MAIAKMLGFEHLPSGIGVGSFANCYGLSQADLGAAAFWNADTGTYPNVAHLRVEDKTMVFGGRKESMGSQGAGSACIPLSKLMGSIDPNKLIIGFRCTRVGNPMTTIPIFALDTVQYGSGGVFANQLLTHDSASALTSNYYEFVFDFVGGKYDVWRDGVITTTQAAIPSGITKSTIKNYYWGMGRYDAYIVPAGTDIRFLSFSDIYVVVDTGASGDTDINRLGPIILKKLNVVSTTGDGWTGAPGFTILEALNTRRDSGKLISPYVAAPTDRTPLRAKVKTSDLTGVNFKGLYVSATAFRDAGVTDGVSAKASYNSTDSTAVAMGNLSTTTPLDQKIFSGSKAPDGTTLTSSIAGNVEIVFTPTA